MNYEKIIELLMSGAFISAVKYLNPKERIRFKRKLSGKKIDKRDKNAEFVLVIGKPNYAERLFLKKYTGKFPTPWITKPYQPKKK